MPGQESDEKGEDVWASSYWQAMGLLLQNIPGAPDLDTAIRFAEEAVAVEFPNAAKVLNALLKLRPERKSTGAGQDARYAIVL